ncbi:hypothetical protein D3C81_558120 [compost metagenome]
MADKTFEEQPELFIPQPACERCAHSLQGRILAYGALRVPRKVKQARFGVRARFQSHQQSATQREAEEPH